MSQRSYHIPVLAEEVYRGIVIQRDGTYYDGCLGGGGHAEYILNQLSEKATYIAVDRDAQAIAFARKRLKRFKNVFYYHGLFDEFEEAMHLAGVKSLTGILLDLGVSSHQIDSDERGFAFRPGIELDMRMNRQDVQTAADILASYPEDRLAQIFKDYGDERHARRIARLIGAERQKEAITRSEQLLAIIDRCVPARFAVKSYARIFQSLRMEVNQELQHLDKALSGSLEVLQKGGRIAVISYHSNEDRRVKNFFRDQENPCTCPPELPVCACGRKPRLKRLKPFVITPGEEELSRNVRARSAKLRIGELL